MADNTPPEVPVPDYRPVERFWPYVDLPEQPTPEELAALHPELAEALFGKPKLPFSLSVEFSPFDGPDYARALGLARAAESPREADLKLLQKLCEQLQPNSRSAIPLEFVRCLQT